MIVNEQVAIDHGLKKDEYAKICELLKENSKYYRAWYLFCNVE